MTDGERDIVRGLEADARSIAESDPSFITDTDELADALAEMELFQERPGLTDEDLADIERRYAKTHPNYPYPW